MFGALTGLSPVSRMSLCHWADHSGSLFTRALEIATSGKASGYHKVSDNRKRDQGGDNQQAREVRQFKTRYLIFQGLEYVGGITSKHANKVLVRETRCLGPMITTMCCGPKRSEKSSQVNGKTARKPEMVAPVSPAIGRGGERNANTEQRAKLP
jgi:hypothetical protein